MRIAIIAALTAVAALASGCGSILNLLSEKPHEFGGPEADLAMVSHMGPAVMTGPQVLGGLAFLFADVTLSCATDVIIFGVIAPKLHKRDEQPWTSSAAPSPPAESEVSETAESPEALRHAYSLALGCTVDVPPRPIETRCGTPPPTTVNWPPLAISTKRKSPLAVEDESETDRLVNAALSGLDVFQAGWSEMAGSKTQRDFKALALQLLGDGSAATQSDNSDGSLFDRDAPDQPGPLQAELWW